MTSLCFLHPPEWFQVPVLFCSEQHPSASRPLSHRRGLPGGSPCSTSLRSRGSSIPVRPASPPALAVLEGLAGGEERVFTVSYYLMLISIKLDSTAHSLGFEWSKSFFIWQPGLLLFMVLPHLLSSAELKALCDVPSAK